MVNDILNLQENSHHLQASSSLSQKEGNDALRKKIKERREAKNLKLKDLEHVIKPAELCKIEGGQRKNISIDTLRKLSPYLGVSLDYLLSLSIIESTSDHERFYDFEGKELDLFKISKKLYSLDTELFLLLSRTTLLEDDKDRQVIKNYLKALSITQSLSDREKFSCTKWFLKLFNDFKDYCLNFFSNLLELSNNTNNL